MQTAVVTSGVSVAEDMEGSSLSYCGISLVWQTAWTICPVLLSLRGRVHLATRRGVLPPVLAPSQPL